MIYYVALREPDPKIRLLGNMKSYRKVTNAGAISMNISMNSRGEIELGLFSNKSVVWCGGDRDSIQLHCMHGGMMLQCALRKTNAHFHMHTWFISLEKRNGFQGYGYG